MDGGPGATAERLDSAGKNQDARASSAGLWRVAARRRRSGAVVLIGGSYRESGGDGRGLFGYLQDCAQGPTSAVPPSTRQS